MVVNSMKNSKNIKEIDEGEILRYIVEYENTRLLENSTIKQLEALEISPDILCNEKEKDSLQRKLTEIRDRFRINPFVIQKGKEYMLKYLYKEGKVIRNNNPESFKAPKTLSKLVINIPKEEKVIQSRETSHIPEVDKILEHDKETEMSGKITFSVKESPPNPRREFRNPEYDNGKLPIIKGLWFKFMTYITYKNYKGKKRFVSVYEKKRKARENDKYYRTADIVPHKNSIIYFKPKIDEKQEVLNNAVNKIISFFPEKHIAVSNCDNNIMRVIKNV